MRAWAQPAGHQRSASLGWLAHPRVRAAVNRRVTGSADRWMVEWLAAPLAADLPLRRALSIGCGLGSLERDLASRGLVVEIEGVDLEPAAIAEAERLARAAGLESRVRYRAAEGEAALAGARELDAVFFHGSLHHFEAVERVLDRAREALRPGGWLILDEYVGPALREWSWARLLPLNLLYWMLPPGYRRPWSVRAPVNPDDPTEMASSSRIPAAVRARFERVVDRPYGGQLLAVLYPNLLLPGERPGGPTPAGIDRVVARWLALEELLLRHPKWPGAASHFRVIVARRAGS